MTAAAGPPPRRPRTRRTTPVRAVPDLPAARPATPGAAVDAVTALARTGSVEGALLELLAAEAPPAEIERLAELAASPAPGPAVAAALQVRALLAGHRRREQERSALYATAGDLSSLRDLEAVLRAIVRRARQLLGSDSAYLTLTDEERGVTYMRVTEGIRTPAFASVLLDLGAGLGGLVASTCTPYATADYAADDRFVHPIDDVVRAEGLVAILGVPLRVGERVIGVLFAADRHARGFRPSEVALLLSLADHAAIAIENAELFQGLSGALTELQQAKAQVERHSEALERAAAVHERLSSVLLTGGGLPELASGVAEVLGGTLLVTDPVGGLLASAGAPLPPEQVEQVLAVVARHGRPGTRAVRLPGPDGAPLSVAGALAGAEALGCLVSCGRLLDEGAVRTLERAAVVTALLLLQQRSLADAEQRLRGELFDELFALPQRDPERLHRRAAHLGADLRRPHVVAVARVSDPARRGAALRAAASLCGADGLSGLHRDDVVLLVAGDDPSGTADRLSRSLAAAAGCPVTVGAAGPGTGAPELAEVHSDAVRCADVLAALERTGEGAGVDDLGVHGLLLSVAGREELGRFVTRTVGPLLDWDRERGSDLTGTLLAWYGCGGNLTRAAAELYVHVNTLYQRLDRVTALLGPGWRSGDTALQVHLALTLSRALGMVAPPRP